MSVTGITNCVNTFVVSQKCMAQSQSPATRGGVRDEDAVGESAHKAVASLRESSGDAFSLRGEWREDQEAAVSEGWDQFWLQAHADDGAGRNPDDRLAATEQDAHALPLHHRVEAADENLALVAHPGNGIEGLEDDGTGALRGAEEACLGQIEQVQGASGPELSGRVAAKLCK